MAKRCVVGNEHLQVRLDERGMVRDIFVPAARPWSYTPHLKHRIGVWVDGAVSWVDEPAWSAKTRRMYTAPVNGTVLVNESIGILLELEDFVASTSDIFMRNIHIVNLRNDQRRVCVFLHQAFAIDSPHADDTGQYIASESAVLHYAHRRAFVATGMTDMGKLCDQYSVGLFGEGLEGTWRDSENGTLSGSASACGRVDSTLGFSLMIGGLSSRRLYYWLSTAPTVQGALALKRSITLPHVFKQLERTIVWWRKWLGPGFRLSEQLSPRYRQGFVQHVMAVRLQQYASGAVVTEEEVAYCNPRDGAYAMWPLIRFGYLDEPLHFFAFCRSVLTEDGCLMSRYAVDKSVGASADAYLGDVPPIQSDGTAIVLFVFSQFYSVTKQREVLDNFYESLVKPMATFLAEFVDEHNLPKPSFDMTNTRTGTYTYTAAVTCAALMAAADMAEVVGDQQMAVSWRTAAEEMRAAAELMLHDEDGTIYNGMDDATVSIASLFGAFMFGLFDPESEPVLRTVETVEAQLRRTDGLFATDETKVAIDYIGSLWMAQYYLETGRKDEAYRIIQAILAEDENGVRIGTWAHAELISTLLDTTYRT